MVVDVFSTVIWAAVTVYAIRQAVAVVDRIIPQKSKEQPYVSIPDDLMALAMSQTEAWAQEDLLRVVREKYEDLRDWNRVRAAMNIGRIDG